MNVKLAAAIAAVIGLVSYAHQHGLLVVAPPTPAPTPGAVVVVPLADVCRVAATRATEPQGATTDKELVETFAAAAEIAGGGTPDPAAASIETELLQALGVAEDDAAKDLTPERRAAAAAVFAKHTGS